jgi:hypothetical protein
VFRVVSPALSVATLWWGASFRKRGYSRTLWRVCQAQICVSPRYYAGLTLHPLSGLEFLLQTVDGSMLVIMSPVIRMTKAQKKVAVALGRLGGQTRAKNLTPERRLEIALKASKAAAKARSTKSKEGSTP